MKISICKREDIPALLDFIFMHWKKDHVFVTCPDLLRWQHENKDGGLNFMLARDEVSDEILGIYGFIPQSFYDEKIHRISGYNEAWGAIWKVKENCTIPGLGVLLLKQVAREFDFLGGIGLSEDSQRIYKLLRCKLGDMNQYYVLNDSLKKYNIAVVNACLTARKSNERNCRIEKLSVLSGIDLKHAYRPFKTIDYLLNRYMNHPYYEYKFLGCYVADILECILVVRNVSLGDSHCGRIVDVYGSLEKIRDLGGALKQYAILENAEYIDFFNWGIDKSYFLNNGFQYLDPDKDEIVIPNYFEPFLQKNVRLNYFYISKFESNLSFFKGDGDQDRPNML